MRRFSLGSIVFAVFLGVVGVAVQASAQQIGFTPSTVTFGSIPPGSTKSQTVTISNVAGRDVNLTQATVSGTGYAITGITYPVLLATGQSTTFNVSFAPIAAGTDSGAVSIVSELWNRNSNRRVKGSVITTTLSLSGSAVAAGQLSVSPASYNFGSVNAGASSTLSATLSATGAAVTISSEASTDSDFSVSGMTLPLTIAAGQSVNFSTKFAPLTSGSFSGNIFFQSNASNASMSMAVSGTGVAQAKLASTPTSFSFGSIAVGSSKSISGSLSNSGGAALTISSAAASSGFTLSGLTLPLTLNAGQSVPFSVAYNPTVAGTTSGTLSITSNASNPNLSIPLSGTASSTGALTSNPASLAFGSVQDGTTKKLSATLTNTGSSSVTISQANISGSGLSTSGLTLPITLTASQSVTFSVVYAPVAAGAVIGNLAIVSNASNATLDIALSGTGTAYGQLAVAPGTLSFGNVVVGAHSALTGTVSATGAPVTISSASTNSSEFVLSGITLPNTIAAGQSAPFTVTFTPSASGTATASLTFQSNASPASVTQTLSGSGTAATQHSVHLTWSASTNVVGYNVYRSSTTGGPYTILNASLSSGSAYTDTTVSAGKTYYYVVTAVDSSSKESGFSNETKAVIPTP